MNVCDFVFNKVKQYDDEIALIDYSTNETIKFSEIESKTEAIATNLFERGIKKGDVVTIIALNEPKYIIIVYAIIRLGAIVNSISSLSTEDTMIQQLKESNTKLVLSNLDLSIPFDKVVHFNDLESDIKTLPDIDLNLDDELLITWTSGTTGKSKGVVHTHKSMLAQYQMFIENKDNKIKDYMGQRHKDVVAGVIPMSNGFGLYVYAFGAIFHGACVVTLSKFDPEKFVNLLSEHKVTVVHAVPTIVNFLAKHPLVENVLPLTSLREIVSGGSPLSENLISTVKKRLDVELRQCYGLVETACVSTPQYKDTSTYSVGKILPGIQAAVRGPLGENDPSNSGELYIRGPNVMKRWLNETENVYEQGFFRTGDVITYEEDGTITIIDRLKDIIKVKGYQVSPTELENIIIDIEKVHDVAVIGVEDDQMGEVPKAFIVRNEESLTKHDVINFIKGKVESYKNIIDVEFVDTIPKTASGKILRSELKKGV